MYPGQIGIRATQTADESGVHRISAVDEYNRNRGCRGLGRKCRAWPAGGDDHRNPAANELGGHLRQPIIAISTPLIFDCDVPALDIAALSQTILEGGHEMRPFGGRCGV